MANIKIVLRKNMIKKDGTIPLAIRISANYKTNYKWLGQYILAKDWDKVAGQAKRSHPNYKMLNNFLLKKLTEANDVYLNNQDENITPKQVKQKLKGPGGSKSFFAVAAQRIKTKYDRKVFSVAKSELSILYNIEEFLNLKTSLTKKDVIEGIAKRRRDRVGKARKSEYSFIDGIEHFQKKKDLKFQDINQAFLERYKTFCSAYLNQKTRTISNQLIFIRTLFNVAIKDGVVSAKYYPFAGDKEKIRLGTSNKIGLTIEEVEKIESLKLEPYSSIWHTHNVWLISFYFAGIRISDVIKLKWSDFKDDRLYYVMNKNEKPLSLKVPEIEGNGFTNDRIRNIQGANPDNTTVFQSNTILKKIGVFARLNYAYKDKYLFNASFRRDGSSVFGLESKWGNFPSVSVGWNVAKENFLLNSEAINNLKFRASYGFTGAENFNVGNEVINTWPYLALLQNTNAVVEGSLVSGISPLNIANALLQWEASEELTVGLDYGFWNNRITGSIDYYQRNSDELLLENPVSYVTGFNSGIVNLGEVQNRGFEFELRTRNISRENFRWNSTFIASTNQNELLSFGDSNNALIEDTYGRNSQWINRIGEPISAFWGYVVDTQAFNETEFRTTYVDNPWNRINGQSQDTIVLDLNGDGIITAEDKTVLGDPYPDLIYSVTNEFALGNVDFSFQLQGSLGAQVNNIGDEYFYNWFGNSTRSGGAEQAVADGLVSDVSFIQEKVLTSEVIASADYFSLRNINIGYNFDSDSLSKVGLSGLRVYATGQNLLYITADDYHGFNPEHDDNGNPRAFGSQRAGTPIFSTLTLGLNIDF